MTEAEMAAPAAEPAPPAARKPARKKARKGVGRRKGAICPHCGHKLKRRELSDGINRCRSCGRSFDAYVLQPMRKIGQRAKPIEDEDEAICGNHEQNAAVASCDGCGIFICRLCLIEGDGEQCLCPACFDRMREAGELASTRTQITNHGLVTFMLAMLAILLSLLAPLVYPFVVASFVVSRRQCRRLGERIGVAWAWIGLLLGTLALIGAAFFWIALLSGMLR